MAYKTSIHPVTAVVLGAFSFGSLFLMISGLFQQDWRAGFGLVLFMTSLVMLVGAMGSESRASTHASATSGQDGGSKKAA